MLEKAEFVTEEYKECILHKGGIYTGKKLFNKRHGKGKFIFCDGYTYIGEWHNDKINGEGTLYNKAGRIFYQGQWLNGEWHGAGKQYN